MKKTTVIAVTLILCSFQAEALPTGAPAAASTREKSAVITEGLYALRKIYMHL